MKIGGEDFEEDEEEDENDEEEEGGEEDEEDDEVEETPPRNRDATLSYPVSLCFLSLFLSFPLVSTFFFFILFLGLRVGETEDEEDEDEDDDEEDDEDEEEEGVTAAFFQTGALSRSNFGRFSDSLSSKLRFFSHSSRILHSSSSLFVFSCFLICSLIREANNISV